MTQANWIHCHFCQRKRSSAATFEREVYKDRPIECEDLCGISVCFYLPEPWQMPVAQAHVFHDCILRVVFSFFIQWQKAFAHERDIKQTYVRYKFCLFCLQVLFSTFPQRFPVFFASVSQGAGDELELKCTALSW